MLSVMKNGTEEQRRRRKSHRRTVWIAICLGLLLTFSVGWDVLQYPYYFAAIYFDWEAKTGFRTISAIPPGEQLDPLTGIYRGLIALQARPWVDSEFRRWGWKAAKGSCSVMLLPFPPLVFGLDPVREWKIIDPEVTPLMLAAERDNLRLVNTILASGGDVNARDQSGWTPLMHACMTRLARSEIVKTLIAAGADVNAKDRANRTALIWVVRTGGASQPPEKVRVLLAAGADPNAKSEFGETPLYEALNARSPGIAAQLLAANADPNLKVRDGTTVLALAERVGDTEMVQLLRRAGAKD